jgi:hypothetical protein
MTKICMLASLIFVTGMIKIPSPIPGSEFQLSAPIAVAIAAVYGFRRYITAGILASAVMFMTGLHTILNVEISMIFRVVAGGIIAIFGPSLPAVLLAGPLGTIAARFGLAVTLNTKFLPLVIASIPGMIFTLLLVLPAINVLKRADKVVMSYGKSKAL